MDTLSDNSRRYYAEGWWRDRIVVDDLCDIAAARPTDIASVTYSADGGWVDRLTFAEMAEAVDSIAAGLLELGVAPGEPVCFQLPSWWYFNAVHLACDRIGAISCPLHVILRRREVEHIIRQVRARVYIGPSVFRGFDHGALGTALVRDIDTLKYAFAIYGPRGSGGSFERHFLGRSRSSALSDAFRQRRPGPDAVATIQFTSGTTGEPKGVMHTHNSLNAATKLVPFSLGLTSDDVIMMPSPLSHATGFVYGCLMPTTYGMKVVYQDLWDAERMLELLDAEGATWTAGSTPFVMDTISACRKLGRNSAPLRWFACSGAPIMRYLAKETQEVTGAAMVTIWGLTETSGATITPAERLDRASDSDGEASPAMQVRVVDDHGEDLPFGSPGRLLVRGASLFVGYFERPELTSSAVDKEGWLDSGDLATIDSEGFIAISGRVKDIVIRGGENIPVVEVEGALHQHDMVQDVAIVGLTDPRLGERACAIVVPTDGSTPTLPDLAAYLESLGFAKQFWPERLELVESLPRTPSGKIQKFLLRKQFDSRREG